MTTSSSETYGINIRDDAHGLIYASLHGWFASYATWSFSSWQQFVCYVICVVSLCYGLFVLFICCLLWSSWQQSAVRLWRNMLRCEYTQRASMHRKTRVRTIASPKIILVLQPPTLGHASVPEVSMTHSLHYIPYSIEYIYIYIYMYIRICIYIYIYIYIRGEGTADWYTAASNRSTSSNCSTGSCLSNFNKRISSKKSNWEIWVRKARIEKFELDEGFQLYHPPFRV